MRLKHFVSMFFLLFALSVGHVWGAQQLAYTLTPATGSDNGYATSEDIVITGITWNVTGNATLTPWRLGGKSISNTDREVYSKTAMGNAITKVELTVGDASSITVNSLKLIVASNANFSNVIDEVTETFAANSTITFTPTSPKTEWATGAYYKFVFNVTVSGKNNKYVAFSEAKFYKEVSTATCENPTIAPTAGTFYGSQEITLSTGTAGASIYYTTDGTTPSSTNGTLYENPFSIDATTTIKAIAIKEGAINSQVAEAIYTAGTPVTSYVIDFEKDLAAYVNWDFTDAEVAANGANQYITAHAGTHYGTTGAKSAASIQTHSKIASPGTLSCYVSKQTDNTTTSTWYIQVSSNGTTWTDVDTKDATSMARGEWDDFSADLSDYSDVYVRLHYSGSTAVRNVDDISLTMVEKYAVTLNSIGGTMTVTKGGNAISSGANIAEGANLIVTANTPDGTHAAPADITVTKTTGGDDVTASVLNGTTLTVPDYAITVTATYIPTYTISSATNVTGGTFSWEETTSHTKVTRAAAGASIQASNQDDGYHTFDSYDIYYMDGTNKVNVDNTDGLFTMPAHDVIISGSFNSNGLIDLDEVSGVDISNTGYPYSGVEFTWNTVENAASYTVVIKNGNEEVDLTGNSGLPTGAYSVSATLAANTTYDYQITAIPTDANIYSASTKHGQFTTGDYPAATVTLNDASGVPYALLGNHKLNDVVTLPNTAATCSKTFVGWTATQNSTTAPEYNEANNYSYTISATTQNLYAVYATVTPGATSTTNIRYAGSTTTNMDGSNQAATLVDATDVAGWSVVGASGAAANNVGLNKAPDMRLYYHEDGGNTLTVTAPQTISSIEITFTGSSYSNAWVKVNNQTITPSEGVYTIGATSFVIGNANTSNAQVRISNIAVHFTAAGSTSGYTTSCVASPEATVDPEEINVSSAAVANGVIDVTYNDHVNLTNVAVARFNDAACTEPFTGEWLTAGLNNDNDIAYTIAENTSYNDVRTAYIKLTAPETNGATDPAVVVIPVTQAKKPAVFASLEDLVAADVNAYTNVTVTFSDVTIKEMYEYNDKVCGVVFDIQKAGYDIKIYFDNQETISDWVPGGTLSGTLTDCPWKIYSSAWQLAPDKNSEWAWNNLTYEEPATVSSVVVSGNPTKTEYIAGQTFSPAGLTVTVNYSNSTSQVNPVGVTFSQHVLTQGTTSINVVASYNNVSSDEYEVTGLTVNPIPNKTINEFITAEGTRCYLTGVVSNIQTNTNSSQNAHGNFNLTDATGTIYVYGCLTDEGVANQFATIGIVEGDKVTVLAESYEYYQSTTHEAKNVQYVSKVPAATITIANKTMEVGDEPWTIEATTDPEGAAAYLSYSIKAGSDDCITLSEGVVTATAEGTATIIASVQDGDDYMANSVEFTVTVNPAAVHTNVVIYAYYGGHYYALTNAVEALEFTVNNNKIIVHNDAEKDAIIWDHAVRGTEHTFYNAASGKYLKGSTSTTLSASAGATGDHYIWQEYANGAYLTTTATAQTVRTILYRNGYGFKNYDVNNAGVSGYANPGITTAEVVVDEQVVREDLTPGKYGTICLEKDVVKYTGATMFNIAWKADDLSSITLEPVDANDTLEAGRPYIFLATGSEIKVQYGTTTADASSHNGLVGSFTGGVIADLEGTSEGMYIIQNNKFYRCGDTNRVGAHKAYIKMDEVPEPTTSAPVPGRRYVTMQIGDVQTPTALDEVTATEENVKFILNGQLYILRDGKLYNAQGQLVK